MCKIRFYDVFIRVSNYMRVKTSRNVLIDLSVCHTLHCLFMSHIALPVHVTHYTACSCHKTMISFSCHLQLFNNEKGYKRW